VQRCRPMLPVIRHATRDAAASWQRASPPTVLLDERGEQVDTPTLARWLSTWRDEGVRRVSFLIGDAHGFSGEDRGRADRVLALSRLTLPHRLAQVLLIEQLYRASTIVFGHPYHHA